MVGKRLQAGEALDVRADGLFFSVWIDGESVASSPEFADAQALEGAIQRLREALAPQD
jgi:tryptophanyl-tRNA synthetase